MSLWLLGLNGGLPGMEDNRKGIERRLLSSMFTWHPSTEEQHCFLPRKQVYSYCPQGRVVGLSHLQGQSGTGICRSVQQVSSYAVQHQSHLELAA